MALCLKWINKNTVNFRYYKPIYAPEPAPDTQYYEWGDPHAPVDQVHPQSQDYNSNGEVNDVNACNRHADIPISDQPILYEYQARPTNR